MRRNISIDCDNRDAEVMYSYYEARIDALKRRVAELEEHNEILEGALIMERHALDPGAASN
jgi:hypothetical protein